MTDRLRVLAFVDYYVPAVKAGGPLRTIAGMVEAMPEARFTIVCRDRDLGDATAFGPPFSGETTGPGGERTIYCGTGVAFVRRVFRLLRACEHDLVYLNSLFSFWFTQVPLAVMILLGWRTPVLLAPRGELFSGALRPRGRIKKAIYVRLLRASGLAARMSWQASSPSEADAIHAHLGSRARVLVASDIPPSPDATPHEAPVKVGGMLRAVYLGRIARQKNLQLALEALRSVSADVQLDVYGPIEDAGYWAACTATMEGLPPNVRVEYRGLVPHSEVQDALAGYHLLVLPSRSENFGHAVYESLATGVPVLVSDTTPWRDLEARGVGWDVPVDASSFAAVLDRVACMDAEEWGRWSRNAREMAHDRSWLEEATQANRFALRSAACGGRQRTRETGTLAGVQREEG